MTALWCTSAVPNHANQVVSTDSTDPYHGINRPVGHEQFYQFFVWIILQTRCGETTQINIILCINMPPLGHNLFWNNVTVSKFNGGHKSFTKNYTLYCSWASFLFAAVPVEHEFKERNPVISWLNSVILLINILLFRICSSSVFSHLRVTKSYILIWKSEPLKACTLHSLVAVEWMVYKESSSSRVNIPKTFWGMGRVQSLSYIC